MKIPEELCGELAQRTKAFAPYKNEIIRYLKWLVFKLDDENEKAHVKDLILKLTHTKTMKVMQDQFFYNYQQMIFCLDKILKDNESEGGKALDSEAVKAIYTLKWYSLDNDEIVSIRLYDIDRENNSIYVPFTQKTVRIDDNDAMGIIKEYADKQGMKIFSAYRKKSGFSFFPYQQNTLLRTIINTPVNNKTISNLTSAIKDKRFKFNQVAEMGAYARLFKIEDETDEILSPESPTFLKEKERCKGLTFPRYTYFKQTME